ncbi:hypothetical protein SODALDRAFT_357064 [Sodiomyces alkalinus F11]|uniref:Uncharacterized protein n=1 Tax=Sodiomyces alkalinus (strain CBS 110278 / VKM F-3762 / F11) TaxID=1314773 RepID=A0A3N2Q2P6_SODAK|nr:hypothetical protein SODALDRAFT_357064 [Sodiomyces alkalinus F11]ROT41039.1 hypothetical protein SODALDRAFT_357064 [Sodiomyces alkalinus F11]
MLAQAKYPYESLERWPPPNFQPPYPSRVNRHPIHNSISSRASCFLVLLSTEYNDHGCPLPNLHPKAIPVSQRDLFLSCPSMIE